MCVPCARRKQVEYTRRHRERLRATPESKVCVGCGITYLKVEPRSSRCPECQKAYKVEYAKRFKEKARAAQKRYRMRLGSEHYREYCRERRKAKIASMTPEQLAEFRRAEAGKSKRLIAQLKDEAFKAYGGWRCSCCSETQRLFLTIDHIHGNGRKMREIHGQTGQFYRWLKKCGYPAGFQVLCINCNFGKHQNGGICPHQVRRND